MASAEDDFALVDEDALTDPGAGETPRPAFAEIAVPKLIALFRWR